VIKRLSTKGLDLGKTFIAFSHRSDEATLNTALRLVSPVGKALHIHKNDAGEIDAVCLGKPPHDEWWKGTPDGDDLRVNNV